MFNWTTHTPISSSPVDLELVNPVPRQLRQDCSGSPLGKSPDPTRGGATQLIESLAWKVSGPSFSRNHRNTTCFFFMGVWEYGSTAHFCWLPWFYFSFLKLLQCFSHLVVRNFSLAEHFLSEGMLQKRWKKSCFHVKSSWGFSNPKIHPSKIIHPAETKRPEMGVESPLLQATVLSIDLTTKGI